MPKTKPLKQKYGNRISVWMTSLGLGDTICATPTVRKLKQLYPGHKIDVYSYYPDLFKYNPMVETAFFFEEEKELNGFYANLRVNEYAGYFQTFSSSLTKPKVDHATTNLIDFCAIMADRKSVV
jgi:ADP-heptose:LPS heptosyltransferase